MTRVSCRKTPWASLVDAIARALVINERTVEVHVSSPLAKFGARTRGEAAAAAHRLRLVPTAEFA